MNYGLIGEKLGHSWSKIIHGMIGDYEYELTEIAHEDLDDFMRKKDFKGINVTIPYKESVIPYLRHIDDLAMKIRAVNTIVNKGGELYGYNTDIYGMKALADRAGMDFKDKKVLILGTGGTSKTAMCLVKSCGAASAIKVSRKKSEGAITYDEARELHRDTDIIINTTPCGMYPNTDTCAADPEAFDNLSAILDVVYNPYETLLVKKGKALGINSVNGLYMLVMQAVKAAELFFDISIDDGKCDEIFEKLKAEMS